MTPHQIIAVGLRLLAVWFALYALGNVYPVVLEVGKTGPETTILISLIVALVTGVIVFGLWHFAQAIARRLLPGRTAEPVGDAVTSVDTWFALGCALIGVWVLVSTLPLLARDRPG